METEWNKENPRLWYLLKCFKDNADDNIKYIQEKKEIHPELAQKILLYYYTKYVKILTSEQKIEIIKLTEKFLVETNIIGFSILSDYSIKYYDIPMQKIWLIYIEFNQPEKAIEFCHDKMYIPWILFHMSREQLIFIFEKYKEFRTKYYLFNSLLQDAEKWRFRPGGSEAFQAKIRFNQNKN